MMIKTLTDFQHKVLNKVKAIPAGRVSTYRLLAQAIGRPKAARAVGNALNCNPELVKIPCHRVVRSTGAIGFYKLGSDRKASLLKKEKIEIIKNRVVDLKKVLFHF